MFLQNQMVPIAETECWFNVHIAFVFLDKMATFSVISLCLTHDGCQLESKCGLLYVTGQHKMTADNLIKLLLHVHITQTIQIPEVHIVYM